MRFIPAANTSNQPGSACRPVRLHSRSVCQVIGARRVIVTDSMAIASGVFTGASVAPCSDSISTERFVWCIRSAIDFSNRIAFGLSGCSIRPRASKWATFLRRARAGSALGRAATRLRKDNRKRCVPVFPAQKRGAPSSSVVVATCLGSSSYSKLHTLEPWDANTPRFSVGFVRLTTCVVTSALASTWCPTIAGSATRKKGLPV